MTEMCKESLTKMIFVGNGSDIVISRRLLDLDVANSKKPNRIVNYAKLLNISASSFSRFIKKSGFPSFKHFSYEYNLNVDNAGTNYAQSNNDSKTLTGYIKTAKRVSKSIENDNIYIITSKRGKSIGRLMNERLNDGGFDNKLYHETTDSLEEFIKKSVDGTLFLVTLSGYSRVIFETLELVNKMEGKKPKVIILTAGKRASNFGTGDFISIGKIKNRDYKIDDWKNYNLCLLDILTLIILIINTLMLNRKKKRNIQNI